MKQLVHGMRRLGADRKGNVLVLAAMSCSLVVGGAGLATDTVQWSLARRQLQQAADAAAVSGAFARAKGDSVNAAAQKELAALAKVASTTAVIENAPTQGAYAGDTAAVRVQLQATLNLPFSRLFMPSGVTIPATATGRVISTGDFCVLALDKVNPGIAFSGNGSLNLGCGLAANSKSTTAISASGSSGVVVTTLASVGGITGDGLFNSDAVFYRNSVPQTDPYATLPVPNPTGCVAKVSVQNNTSASIAPGCYAGFDVKGTLNLSPGVYYIDGSTGGDFSVGAQGTVIGSDVTIILTSTTASTRPSSIASPNIAGGATLTLSNSTTGTYAGILFYQDPRAVDSGSNQINGNTSSSLQGALYFPSQALLYNGNTSMQTNCLQLVAKRVTFTGNSRVNNVCPPNSNAGSFKGTVIRLVE